MIRQSRSDSRCGKCSSGCPRSNGTPRGATFSTMNRPGTERREITELLGKLASGKVDKKTLKKLASTLRRSMRISRKGVTLSGQGIADLLLAVAPRIPVRDFESLQNAHDGAAGASLAAQVIRSASRASAAVGGATGALASVNELAPPFWIMLPAEIVAETLVVAAIEMRMVAEIHAVYGKPIEGTPKQRGLAMLQSWSERRGVHVEDLDDQKALSKALGKGTTSHVVQLVKRKLTARLVRNVSSLAPLFVGAVAGAELNRRSTRDLGDAVVRHLAAEK